MSAHGIEISVVAPPGFHGPEGIPLVYAPIESGSNPIQDLRAAAIVSRLAQDADLIHGHGLRGAWIAHLAARKSHKPYLFTAHNLAPESPGRLAGRLLRGVIQQASGIIAVSQAVAYSLVPHGASRDRVTVIPNGIDLSKFDRPRPRPQVLEELGLPQDCRLVAAAGRLSPEKGFATLIEAAAHAADEVTNAQFVIAGDGPEWERLAALSRSLGIDRRVHLPRRIEDIPSLFHAAVLVVVPSLLEGQGIVALEAMGAGRPVVATNVGGLSETIVAGVTGVLVKPGDPVELAAAIRALLNNAPNVRARMGAAGRARVEAMFTSERMTGHIVELYRSLA